MYVGTQNLYGFWKGQRCMYPIQPNIPVESKMAPHNQMINSSAMKYMHILTIVERIKTIYSYLLFQIKFYCQTSLLKTYETLFIF